MNRSVLRVIQWPIYLIDIFLFFLLVDRWAEVLRPMWPDADFELFSGLEFVHLLGFIVALLTFGAMFMYFYKIQERDREINDDTLSDSANSNRVSWWLTQGFFVGVIVAVFMVFFLTFQAQYDNPFLTHDIGFGTYFAHSAFAIVLTFGHLTAAQITAQAVAMNIEERVDANDQNTDSDD